MCVSHSAHMRSQSHIVRTLHRTIEHYCQQDLQDSGKSIARFQPSFASLHHNLVEIFLLHSTTLHALGHQGVVSAERLD